MIRFEDLKPAIGSRVIADKAELLTSEGGRLCREKLEERTVLVFPRLGLNDEEQLAFTDLLGDRVNFTDRNATTANTTENDVYKVTLDAKVNKQPEYVLGTFFWHMDGLTVDMPPPFASLLSARAVAPHGGQTEFASTYAAYKYLPDDEKAEIESLKASHSVRASLRPIEDAIPAEQREQVLSIGLVKDHPLVWKRSNGRASLVIGTTTDRVVDMPIPEGRALLTRLVEWAAQPDFSYRHQWEEGDFVAWDNTGALHRVIPYAANSGRMMHRTSIAGTEAVQ